MANEMTDDIETLNQTSDRRYFTMIPNVLDEIGLSPYAIRLYFRLLRRAGENGECWENTQHLSEGCRMSRGKISITKLELESAGLITIKTRSLGHGHFPGHIITINNIWKTNIEYFENDCPVHIVNTSCSRGDPRPVHLEGLRKTHLRNITMINITVINSLRTPFHQRQKEKTLLSLTKPGLMGPLINIKLFLTLRR